MKDLEIKELYKVLEDQWGDSENYINDLIRYSKELQDRIDKAIQNINEKLSINSEYVDYDFGSELLKQELLDILKGSDK